MNDEQFFLSVDADTSFTETEYKSILEGYVCGICHGPLTDIFVPNTNRVMVVCLEHGNVCTIGRVTNATVAIEKERAIRKYHSAIRALPDLWGDLLNQGIAYVDAVKISKYYVCAVCGQGLQMTMVTGRKGSEFVDLVCPHHGNVNDCGYIKKEHFVYNFQAIRAWEKSHKKQGV